MHDWFSEMNEVSSNLYIYHIIYFRNNKCTSKRLKERMISSSKLHPRSSLKRISVKSKLISFWKRWILWKTENTSSIKENQWLKEILTILMRILVIKNLINNLVNLIIKVEDLVCKIKDYKIIISKVVVINKGLAVDQNTRNDPLDQDSLIK